MNIKSAGQGVKWVLALMALGPMSLPAFAQSAEYRRGYDEGYRDGYEAQHRNDRHGQSGERIFIVEASYGTRNATCSARDTLQRALGGQHSMSIVVNNELCGDPAPNRPKRLEIVYRCGNAAAVRARAEEGATITLNCRER